MEYKDGNGTLTLPGAMQTFVHTFEDKLNSTSYKALAVHHGVHQVSQVLIWNGRQCYATKGNRVRSTVGRRFYETVVVHYIDDRSAEAVPLGKFNSKVKAAPLPQGEAA